MYLMKWSLSLRIRLCIAYKVFMCTMNLIESDDVTFGMLVVCFIPCCIAVLKRKIGTFWLITIDVLYIELPAD